MNRAPKPTAVASPALFAPFALSLALLLAACGPRSGVATGPAEDDTVAKLRAEIQRLKVENEELKLSPSVLAREVQEALRTGDAVKAESRYKRLADNFPFANETVEMRKRMDTFMQARLAEAEEGRRIAAQGFRALPVIGTVAKGDTSMQLGSTAWARRWIFDSWGEGWRFLDAEKDRRLLVARLTVSSKQKEPALFGVAAYAADGAKLQRLGELKYRFARWTDYGAFLGTHADYANDFSRSWKVPFTAGVQLSEADLKRKPIYLVATSEGCHTRRYERFGQPPVVYDPAPCASLKETLSAEDFHGNQLVVLKRIE